MDDFRYPLVSELLYQAKNHCPSKLSACPIGQLWHIDPVDPAALLTQIHSLLQSEELTPAEQLKLGFLAAYSWPMHYHPKTQDLILTTQSYINAKDTQESLLFWSATVGFYLRQNQILRAFNSLSAAFDWASKYASLTDLFPLLNWSILCFSRTNRQREALQYSNLALELASRFEDSYRIQAFTYARAHTLLRLGNYTDSRGLYENLHRHVDAGTALFEQANHTGVLCGLAKIAIENRQFDDAAYLLGRTQEMLDSNSENLLIFRCLVLQCDFDLATNNKIGARDNLEAFTHHRLTHAFELDIPSETQAMHLQQRLRSNCKQPIQATAQPKQSALELAIAQLQKSARQCLSTRAHKGDLPQSQALH